jgi:hypothetical protein
LADNSVSLPGSPVHCAKSIVSPGPATTHVDDTTACGGSMNQDIDIPSDMVFSIMPGLEKLVLENLLSMEQAQKIIQTQKVPIELGHYFGLYAHTAPAQPNYQILHHSQSVSPINYMGKYSGAVPPTGGGGGSPFVPNLSHFGGLASNNLVNCFAVASAAAVVASSVPGNV